MDVISARSYYFVVIPQAIKLGSPTLKFATSEGIFMAIKINIATMPNTNL